MKPIFRPLLAAWLRLLAPRMRYGLASATPDASGSTARPHSRMGSHTHVEAPERLSLGDHVFIGHFNFIDASGGLAIGTGCQITNHVSVLTHSSHRALRLEREAYWGHPAPAGLQREPVVLGDWSFVGPHSTIAPGTRLGCGVLVRACSFVSGDVPDFAIVEGQPARVVGDTRELDRAWMERHAADFGPAARAAYEAWVLGVEAAATPPNAAPPSARRGAMAGSGAGTASSSASVEPTGASADREGATPEPARSGARR